MIKLGLLGANGRMGQMIAKICENEFSEKLSIHGRVSDGDSFDELLNCDLLIEFSLPPAMDTFADFALASEAKKLPPWVSGTTGWKIPTKRKLEAYAEKAPVLVGNNFSTGVMALIHVLKNASPMLDKLGYSPVITETHHIHKKDAPSGTAVSMQRAISPTGPGNVKATSIRAGEVIGDHDAKFYGKADILTIGHHAQDRTIFARGAIEAGIWLVESGEFSNGLHSAEQYFEKRFL